MTKEEFEDKRRAMNVKHGKEQSALAREFVLANRRAEIGDFITDHMGTIKLERITVGMGISNTIPTGVYHGPCYTKAGKPFKSGEMRGVWGGNIEGVKKHG